MYYSKEVQESLDYILNKAFCYHTFQKAVIAYNNLLPKLLPEDRYCIKNYLIEIDPTYTDGCGKDGEERGIYGERLAKAIKSIQNRQSEHDDTVWKAPKGAIWARDDDGRYPVDPGNDYEMTSDYEKE